MIVAGEVLRLDRMPTIAALERAGALIRFEARRIDAELRRAIDETPATDACLVCRGTRTCPDCGGPCEVCTLRDGGTGRGPQ